MKIFKKDLWAKPLIALLTESTDALDGANDALSIYDASAGEERRISPDNLAKSTKTMFIPAGAMNPSKTNGALWQGNTELTTNKQTIGYYEFSPTTAQGVEFIVAMPLDWDGGNLQYIVYWTCSGGASGGTAYWGLQGRCYANDDALDQTYSSASYVTDDWVTSLDLHVSDKSGNLALSGNNAGGNLAWFRFIREAANATDDLTVTARLLGIMLYYGVNKWSE